MNRRILAAVTAAFLGTVFSSMTPFAQTQAPAGPPRAPAQDNCNLSHFCGIPYKWVPSAKTPTPADGQNWRSGEGIKLTDGTATAQGGTNGWGKVCWGSPICAWTTRTANEIIRVVHKPDMGYTFAYPLDLPEGTTGGVTGVGINSKGHIFAYVRAVPGLPQIFEWDENHKFLRGFGENLAGKTHGMAIDAQDNIWIVDQFGDTVMELNPQGQLIKTIGVKGQRGDWDEAKGQRLLWQPLAVAFAPNGDIYIGMGHANESPNDGAARVLHLDKNGKYVNQWFGNSIGPGKFSMVHGIAVNPQNGNVYIADREEYRIVVYDKDGKFVKTLQEPNLVCTVSVDRHNQLWMASGQDGQVLKLDWDGKIIGAAGVGPGNGPGQFSESNYIVEDIHGNLFVGDTSITRVTELVAPRR